MLKKIREKIDEYAVMDNSPSYVSKEWENQCYFCGYIDGYFDEELYKMYIDDTINNEHKLVKYNEGFNRGIRDRRLMKDNHPKDLIKEKENFIKRLALNDVMNKVETRNLKEDALDMYDFYKGTTFSFNRMDYEEKYKPKKR